MSAPTAQSLRSPTSFRQFRVPRESGRALIDPSLSQVREGLVESSDFQRIDWKGLEFCGKPLDVVRSEARREAVELALEYTQAYRDIPAATQLVSEATPLILSGHQPELFHAGVWFKNFLISQLAADTGALAINFLVDNDLCRTPAIRVPGRTEDGSIVATSIPFDAPSDNVPWEMRQLKDPDLWRNFPRAVRQQLLQEIEHPLVEDMWRFAPDAIARSGRIGAAIAEARHRLEATLGLETLEVPLSRLVSTRAFARFSIQLMSELPRFQHVYNVQRDLYRTAHGIRSHAHPVPPLEQQSDGWLEGPWWVYRPESPKRERLWVKMIDDRLLLSDRAGWQAVIEGRLECDNAATQWLKILASGVSLRPRALLTTMYLRICVGDTFVHGIGGGKYDQLTDAIIQDFFAITPPPFVVASATMRLPATLGPELETSAEQERQRLWQLKFHADALLSSDAVAQSDAPGIAAEGTDEAIQLALRKRQLLANIPERGDKWKWHREITAVNRRLAELAQAESLRTKERLEQVTLSERQQRVLESREHSFCLFPLEQLAPELKRLASLQ